MKEVRGICNVILGVKYAISLRTWDGFWVSSLMALMLDWQR
jgi:hypothetical protein